MSFDFVRVSTRFKKAGGVIEVYPKFIIKQSKDLMIRGSDFYAIWDEDQGLWSTSEQDAIRLIDRELDAYVKDNREHLEASGYTVLYLWDADSAMIDKWHKYCQKQMRDNYHQLDDNLIFGDQEPKKEDYASKKLSYPLKDCPTPAYDEIMSTLYSDEARHKLEWAIGSIVNGDSKKIQKFIVLYGSGGTGKSTVLNIIQELFDGYYAMFDAKALGSPSAAFALEAFKSNPLVAIQHDGDLSHIEDNTRLNSLVSHEIMVVNEKFKSQYSTRFRSFLFMGTNKPVRITDAKSGLIRRLIDVSPTGNILPARKYNKDMSQIKFELGGIALHCKQVYEDDPGYYDDYIPVSMLGATNDFYNFVLDSYFVFKDEDGVSLKVAYERYKAYCEDARVSYPYPRRAFQEELKNYFKEVKDRYTLADGTRVRNYYCGFLADKFENASDEDAKKPAENDISGWIELKEQPSRLDDLGKDWPAQYAIVREDKTQPGKSWDKNKTTLSDLDTHQLHFLKPPYYVIMIDFDCRGPNGEKDLSISLAKANAWPKTYCEVSQSGKALHLIYIYEGGDVSELSSLADDNVEIKRFTGGSSMRRKLSLCNDLPIATISSGLPKRERKPDVIDKETVSTEKELINKIKQALRKEIQNPYTTPCMNWIKKLTDDAYESGIPYDISYMRSDIMNFAGASTHHAATCMKIADSLHYRSKTDFEDIPSKDNKFDKLIFFDCEVFPNLFILCYKVDKTANVVRLINPPASVVSDFIFSGFKLVGFNNLSYDNNILYARAMGASNMELFNLSCRIIANDKDTAFSNARNISYTDIFDFASAGNKKSLKKLEYEMKMHHQECPYDWSKPVPKEAWESVADYCCNDVLATEAAFYYLESDFTARKILAALTGKTVNTRTNALSIALVFGNDKAPQSQFMYRDLSKPVGAVEYETWREAFPEGHVFRVFDANGDPTFEDYVPGIPLPEGWSILPFFPGYEFKHGVSTYLGDVVGEGGLVFAKPGMYFHVKAEDVSGMHPSSMIAEALFGRKHTQRFADIVQARQYIKHNELDKVEGMFEGRLKPFIDQIRSGEIKAKDLSNALKTVVNSFYGLTAASFDNACRDPRNVDNIVAKRGALFMQKLKAHVLEKGFDVVHIKTDCIKIPEATPEIIKYVEDFGKEYGYRFELENDFEKFCLVNHAVYVGKRTDGEWVTVGTQFQIPYVKKTLFSHEEITFDDLCEMKSVKTSLYLDMNENLPDVSLLEKELDKRLKKNDISEEEANELRKQIAAGHNYIFIGRTGVFCPMKPGVGGGLLMRDAGNGKYSAVTGSKGYRWMETEQVKQNSLEDSIDRSYYRKLVDDAIDAISKYGDYDAFVA